MRFCTCFFSIPSRTRYPPSRSNIRKAVSGTGVANRTAPESLGPHPKSRAWKGNLSQSVMIVNSVIEGKNLSEEYSRAFAYNLIYSSVITSLASWILWIVWWRGSLSKSFTEHDTEASTKALPVKFSPSGGRSLLRESTGNCKHMLVLGCSLRAITLACMDKELMSSTKL